MKDENRPNPPVRKRRITGTIRRDRLKTESLDRIDKSLDQIAESLSRLVIAADSIAMLLSLHAISPQIRATGETLDELMLRHERITRDK